MKIILNILLSGNDFVIFGFLNVTLLFIIYSYFKSCFCYVLTIIAFCETLPKLLLLLLLLLFAFMCKTYAHTFVIMDVTGDRSKCSVVIFVIDCSV